MPADITGTDIIQDDSAGGTRQFEFIKGPVFANVVLADEIKMCIRDRNWAWRTFPRNRGSS